MDDLALLWDATVRRFAAIRNYDGTWFIQSDLGVSYEEAKNYLEVLNNEARNTAVL